MPGRDDPAGAPGARLAQGNGQSRGGSAKDLSRGSRAGSVENKPLSGSTPDGLRGGAAALGQDRGGRPALGKQTVSGAVDQHDTGARVRPFHPPAILRAPSSLLSGPVFLRPVPPFRAASLPRPVAAPLLFAPPSGTPQQPVPVDSTAPQTQTPDAPQPTPPPAEVLSPKVELSVTSSPLGTAQTSAETPTSALASLAAASPSPSLEPAIASTTSNPAPAISPIAAPQVNSSFASPDILPATNTGGKVAAACVIGAVFCLLLNWAFWLVIRRRRRARRLMPAHWDFAAPPPGTKGEAGRESEDAFVHAEPDERVAGRDVKGGMVTIPV